MPSWLFSGTGAKIAVCIAAAVILGLLLVRLSQKGETIAELEAVVATQKGMIASRDDALAESKATVERKIVEIKSLQDQGAAMREIFLNAEAERIKTEKLFAAAASVKISTLKPDEVVDAKTSVAIIDRLNSLGRPRVRGEVAH